MLFYICSNISNQFTWWELGLKLFTNMLMPLCGHVYVLILYTSPSFSHRIFFPTFPYTFPCSPFVPKATFEIVDHAFICCFLSTRPVWVRMSNFTIYFQWSINFFVFPGKFNLLLYRIVILYMITFTFSPFFVLVCPWSDSVITLT